MNTATNKVIKEIHLPTIKLHAVYNPLLAPCNENSFFLPLAIKPANKYNKKKQTSFRTRFKRAYPISASNSNYIKRGVRKENCVKAKCPSTFSSTPLLVAYCRSVC